MKHALPLSVAAAVVALAVGTGTAAAQTVDPTATTSTSVAPTTAAPTTTSTSVAPAVTTTVPVATTSTVPTATTSTIAPAAEVLPVLPPVNLPGVQVTQGTLNLGAAFTGQPAASCSVSGSLAGGQVNVIRNANGSIAAAYGTAQLGSSQGGLVMLGFGPLPLGIAAYRTVGACNQDVITVGGFTSSATSASISSIGYGIFPGDFARQVDVSVTATETAAGASLDLPATYAFLATPRGVAK